jgi:hypothetical protein
MGADFSPILGPSGNIEFLFHLKKEGIPLTRSDNFYFEDLVERAHRELIEDGDKKASGGGDF